jgi:hypothetical protein
MAKVIWLQVQRWVQITIHVAPMASYKQVEDFGPDYPWR